MKNKAAVLIMLIEQTLQSVQCDYQGIIKGFGQVYASYLRQKGKSFPIRDHLRGLVLALLSNQRPWKPVAQKIPQIDQIFYHYDPQAILKTAPEHFINSIRAIRCGNRNLKSQMTNLQANVATFVKIQKQYGTIDTFVTHSDPWNVAEHLAKPGSPYKMKWVGPALALEYLKNVGIRASKPDEHVRRFLSGQRLGFFSGIPTEKQAYHALDTIAQQAGCDPTYVDNLIWIFCATGYGNICGAQPKCNVCGLAGYCAYSSGTLPNPQIKDINLDDCA